jgi:signal transduction histidine kinase/ligand-binding sensor protein
MSFLESAVSGEGGGWLVTNRIGYSFEDLVDIEHLRELMDLFFAVSSIPSAIIDADGTIQVATGWQDICTQFHRVHPVTAQRCRESDEYIQEHLHEKKYVQYKCKNGLWDVAVPIVISGRHLTTLFLGQFFYQNEQPDEDFFRQQAEEFGFDEAEYLAALSRVPVFSREEIQHLIDYKLSFVKLLSTLGLQKLELTREIHEREKTERALRAKSGELEERVKELNMFFSLSKVVGEKGNSLGEIVQGIADLIPSAMRYPELSCARILLKGEEFRTQNFQETERKHRCNVLAGEERIGHLEVCLSGENADAPEDSFLDEEKGLMGVIAGALGGIVQRHEAEEKLRQSQEQLYQAQKMETLGTLVAGVAHEINNPTNLIMLNVRLLQKVWPEIQPILREQATREPERKYAGLSYDFLEENTGQLLADMEMGCDRITRCVKDLKDYARRSDVTEKEPMSINRAVENALRLSQTTVRRSRVVLEHALDHDLPLMEGNLQSIEQIVLNLLLNAVQAIDHDRGRVQVTTGSEKKTGRVFVSVSDNGPGIDSAVSDRIYEPFVTNKQSEGGLGLGLSITKNLTEIHGGEIRYRSQRGEGTTFSVFFPCIGE